MTAAATQAPLVAASDDKAHLEIAVAVEGLGVRFRGTRDAILLFERLPELGETNADVVAYQVLSKLAEVHSTSDEARAFLDQHRELGII